MADLWHILLNKFTGNKKFNDIDFLKKSLSLTFEETNELKDEKCVDDFMECVKNTSSCYGCFMDTCKNIQHKGEKCKEFRKCQNIYCSAKHAQLCKNGGECSFGLEKCLYRHISNKETLKNISEINEDYGSDDIIIDDISINNTYIKHNIDKKKILYALNINVLERTHG